MKPAIKRRIFAAAVAAIVAGSLGAPLQAAELGVARPQAKHARATWHRTWQAWNWRDRCAWEGYYCLYAEYGYVYHYPWDDRPIATAYYARRHHRR